MNEVSEKPLPQGRKLAPGQRTEVWIADLEGAAPHLVYTTQDLLLEAPNWAPDGSGLLLNGDGVLWRLDLDGTPALTQIPIDDLPPINNDHVVDPPRDRIFLSANDGHLYVAPIEGGAAVRISSDPDHFHFLHGVTPDGTTLAYVELPRDNFSAPGRLSTIASAGGPTTYPESGDRHIDGPEYSPDGAWLYLNTEQFGSQPGHAQIARVESDGGELEQLVKSETVDWFPHLSPDGRHAFYISFPTGTLGHPADLEVEIHVVATDDWNRGLFSIPLFGGQGTCNVNSWSPDSRRFAYVAYPIAEQA